VSAEAVVAALLGASLLALSDALEALAPER
jgi:hypothetical protein